MGPHRSRWLAAAALLLATAGCVGEPLGVSQEALAVPGAWDPPARTRAISDPQRVEVTEPPAVLPLGRCTSTDPWEGTCSHPACTRAHPGTTELDAYIRATWPHVRAGGTYSCRRNSNPSSTEYLSVHSVGRAIDLMITEVGGDADNSAGDPVANWLIENAEYIGVQRVIWDGIYWNGSRRNDHFRPITGSASRHTNHIHVELSEEGAARLTRFFMEGPPPEEVLDGAFVSSDFPGGTTIEVPVGREVHGCLTYTNTGTVEWLPGTTNLGTTEPRDHASPFPGSDWLGPARLATISGRTPAGASEQFCFSLRGADEPGSRVEHFSLVHETHFWAADTGGVSDATNYLTVVTVPPPPQPVQVPDAGSLADAGPRSPDASGYGTEGGSMGAPPPSRTTLTGSCSAAPGGSSSPAALLALLATVAVVARRRRGVAPATSSRTESGRS